MATGGMPAGGPFNSHRTHYDPMHNIASTLLIGMWYAGLLTTIGGEAWLQNPTPGLALVVGLGTVAAPFLLMQPAMGGGIAARHMAQPGSARLHSLLMHAVFGIGLLVSAWVLREWG